MRQSQINSVVTNDSAAYLGIIYKQTSEELPTSYELHPKQRAPLSMNTDGIHVDGIYSWVTDAHSFLQDFTSTVDVGVVVNSVDQAFQDINCQSINFIAVSSERNENWAITKSMSTTESANQDNCSQSLEAVAMSYIDYDLTVNMTDNREITSSMVQTIEEVSQDDGHDLDASESLFVSQCFQSSVTDRGKKIWKKNSCVS